MKLKRYDVEQVIGKFEVSYPHDDTLLYPGRGPGRRRNRGTPIDGPDHVNCRQSFSRSEGGFLEFLKRGILASANLIEGEAGVMLAKRIVIGFCKGVKPVPQTVYRPRSLRRLLRPKQ